MPSKFDPKNHHRKSIRLPGYDYLQAGAYYVTIVTWQRDCLFGEVMDDEICLSSLGKIADECWRAIPKHFPNVELGAHIVMPNHVHGIIVIRENESLSTVGAQHPTRGRCCCAPTPIDQHDNPHKINVKPGSLCAIVRSFKSAVSYRINKEHNTTGIWQRNYYEHIIRNERDMQAKWDYILGNPAIWDEDEANPKNPNSAQLQE